MVLASIRAGLEMLRANPLRALLSTLGVIMGAASLVAVLSLGDGAEAFARARVYQEGYNHIVIEPITSDLVDGQRIARASFPVLGVADVETLGPVIADRAAGAVMIQDSMLWPAPGGTRRGLRVTGLHPVAATLPKGAPLVAGRALTAEEARADAGVCVVSRGLAGLLAGGGDPAGLVGRAVSVGSQARRIVGIQADGPGERGFSITMPFAAAARELAGAAKAPARRIVLETIRLEDVRPLADAVRVWAGRRADWRDAVRVTAVGQTRLQEIERGILVFKMLMGAFTAIALIVGGIGIMNVLLASVAERTREIGIRKAVGARRRDILAQFLTESVAIAGAGCLLGLIAGLAGAFGVTALIRAQTTMPVFAGVSWGTVIASGFAALLVGLVFGTYPALRAARLTPVDAIQRE